jgi:microcystin-dependent protein
MATHDYVIDNDTAANVRADINSALAAIRSSNLDPNPPANLYAGLFWFDSALNELKLRNAANDGWIVMGKFSGNANTSDTPSGAILQFAGSSAPANWLLCDGSLVSRTTYATLFGVVGTNYGAGDGSTTFKLPDMRGRVPIGAGQGSSLTNRVIAATGGAETHTLLESEMPSHTHDLPLQSVGPAGGGFLSGYPSTGSGIVSSSKGGDAPHNNMQPFLVVNHIIKV